MNIPQRNRHWLKEIKKGLSNAEKTSAKSGANLEFLYKIAPEMAMKKRGVSLNDEIADDVEERVLSDWEYDEGSKQHYRFHFVSSYIFSHVPAGLLSEMEADRIMEYINENMELFSNA